MPKQYSNSTDSQPTESKLSKRVAAFFATTVIASTALALTTGLTGCDNLVTEQVTFIVAGHPTAEFGVDVDSGCAPMTVLFSDESNGPRNQWLWKFGDGDSSTDTTPTHTYTTPGTYTVSLKITDTDTIPSATDSETKKRFIVVGTSIGGFTMDTAAGCVGQDITFTPSFAGVTSFAWNFGDGGTSTDTFPTHTFGIVGDFPITLIVNGACGVDTAFDTVRIGNCPSFTFAADTNGICIGDSIVFTESNLDSLPHSKFTWDFGDGTTLSDTVNSAEHIYADTGLFTVTLTVENSDSLSTTDSLVDYIRVNDVLTPDFVAISPTFACETPASQFVVGFNDKSTGGITNRIWNFGDGTFDSTNNPTPFHAYTTVGQYNVTLQVFAPCGANSSETAVKPSFVTFAGPLTIGASISKASEDTIAGTITYNFQDISLGVPSEWRWDFGDGQFSNAREVTHVYPDTAAVYIVTFTIANACSTTQLILTDSTTVVIP